MMDKINSYKISLQDELDLLDECTNEPARKIVRERIKRLRTGIAEAEEGSMENWIEQITILAELYRDFSLKYKAEGKTEFCIDGNSQPLVKVTNIPSLDFCIVIIDSISIQLQSRMRISMPTFTTAESLKNAVILGRKLLLQEIKKISI